MSLAQISSPPQASAEVVVNRNMETLEHQAVYGQRQSAHSGLTWGYYGGRWGGTSVAEGTLSLTNAATNYVVVNRSTAAISVSTATTNWNDTTNYARVYKLTTAGSVVTAAEDHRAGTNGVHGGGGGGGAGTVGRHAIYIPARNMTPSVVDGCAALATIATSADHPDVQSLDFDASAYEYAQFSIVMPKSWDEGDISFKAHWSHASTATNFGVAWDLQGVAVGNGETIDTGYGGAETVTDTGGVDNYIYTTPESNAFAVGGTVQPEDLVFFRVNRPTANPSDNLGVDARLHGITVYITTDAETDA